jgi:hypothetical protein
MAPIPFDLGDDVDTVCLAVAFLPRLGATRAHLETINGVSYADGSRFGNALAAAIARGRVVRRGDRYHLTEGASPDA